MSKKLFENSSTPRRANSRLVTLRRRLVERYQPLVRLHQPLVRLHQRLVEAPPKAVEAAPEMKKTLSTVDFDAEKPKTAPAKS